MSQQTVNLDPQKILSAIVANLNSQFYACGRDDSKRLYKMIMDDEHVPFIQISTPDSGEIYCTLMLDYSQYTGKLNYGKFRKALAVMMLGIQNRIEKKESLNMMTSQDGDMIFNVPGILQNADGVNVLVCGIRQTKPGFMTIRLLFLDPSAYETELRKTAVKVENDSTE